MSKIDELVKTGKLFQKEKNNAIKNLHSLRTAKKTFVSSIKVKKLVRRNSVGSNYSELTREINSLRQFLKQTEDGIKAAIIYITHAATKEYETVQEINKLCE